MPQKVLRTIDLFAGCGGLSLGLKRAGFQGLFAIEKHRDAFATLDKNLGSHFLWPSWLRRGPWDIVELLVEHARELRSMNPRVDLMVGGPPCQGFSTAGQRRFGDARNKLIDAYVAAVEILQPRAVLIENVRGFTMKFKNVDSNAYSTLVIEALQQLGYGDARGQLFDLSEFGVPQRRQRYIIAATRDERAPLFFKTLKANAPAWLRKRGLPRQNTASMALSDLQSSHGVERCPGFPRFQAGVAGPAVSAFQRWARGNNKENGPVNSHRYVNHRKEATKVFQRMLRSAPRNRSIMLTERELYGLRKRSATVLGQRNPAPTVTSIPDDLIHYNEPRVLTVRECARLQTFPDSFEFEGPYTTGGKNRRIQLPRYTQVANAVPPLFAEQIGEAWQRVLSDG